MGKITITLTLTDYSTDYANFTILVENKGYDTHFYKPILLGSTTDVGLDATHYMWSYDPPDGFQWLSEYDSYSYQFTISGNFELDQTYYWTASLVWADSQYPSSSYYVTASEEDTPLGNTAGQPLFCYPLVSFVNSSPLIPVLLQWSWTNETGSWNAIYSSNNAAITAAAYTALNNKQSTRNFSHLVWNDLCWWLLDIKVSLHLAGGAPVGTMDSNDTVLTANRWNNFAQVWDTIANELGSNWTLRRVNQYDPVMASYISYEIVQRMNTLIRNFNNSH